MNSSYRPCGLQQGMLLLVHGEVTDAEIDIFDREAIFITEKLIPILDKVPELKVWSSGAVGASQTSASLTLCPSLIGT